MLISAYNTDQFKEVEELFKRSPIDWKGWDEAIWTGKKCITIKRRMAVDPVVLPIASIESVSMKDCKDGLECTSRGTLGEYHICAIIQKFTVPLNASAQVVACAPMAIEHA